VKLVKPDDWVNLQVFGALLNGAPNSCLADRRIFADIGRRFFKIQT
jgi:hypothetical protein